MQSFIYLLFINFCLVFSSWGYHFRNSILLTSRCVGEPVLTFSTKTEQNTPQFQRGQSIKVSILQFGPLGASVDINHGIARGYLFNFNFQ